MGVNRNIPELPKLDDPNDNTLLEAFHGGKNMRILLGKIKEYIINALNFKSIKLIPQSTTPTTVEGELYFNGVWHTIDYNTGLGATIKVGNTLYDVFYNNTGDTIESFRALHLSGAVSYNSELYPTFELADPRTWEKVQGTIIITCCDVLDGALGIGVRSATKITGGDTSAVPAGSQLWIKDDGSGELTDDKPAFPNFSISVGGNYNQESAPDGEIFINITSTVDDIFHDAWDGAIVETFDFRTSSNGTVVTGTLENVDNTRNLTLRFSDDFYTLDTTTTPLTIELTPGTDSIEATNYVYIPKATKVLTLSTSGWPSDEHCRIAELEIQSAATTQVDGGTLGNQNTNDHIKKEDNNGHVLHITEWIREQYATMRKKYGSESSFNNTGGNGYIEISGGYMLQAHPQTLDSFSMVGGDSIRVWNDNLGTRPKITNLTSITEYSDGSAWNNQWSKIVVWRVGNKGGEYSPVMFNLPSDGYNTESAAIADLSNYAEYTIPDNFKTKAVLIGAFTFRVSGGTITYNTGYEDLRGQLPIVVPGGGSGGGGVTTLLALSDISTAGYSGLSGQILAVNSGESDAGFTDTLSKQITFLEKPYSYSDSTSLKDIDLLKLGTNYQTGVSALDGYFDIGFYGANDIKNAAIRFNNNDGISLRTSIGLWVKNAAHILINPILFGEEGYTYLKIEPATDSGTNDILTRNASNGRIEKRNNIFAPETISATSKTTPVDADLMAIVDSAASNVIKKLTWANLKATLKTYFDTLYNNYTLTKAAIEAVFTGDITTHTHNTLYNNYTLTKAAVETVLTGVITSHSHNAVAETAVQVKTANFTAVGGVPYRIEGTTAITITVPISTGDRVAIVNASTAVVTVGSLGDLSAGDACVLYYSTTWKEYTNTLL